MPRVSSDRLWARSPFGVPHIRLAIAAHRAGARPLLELGSDREQALDALTAVLARVDAPIGVALGDRPPLEQHELPAGIDTVVGTLDVLDRWLVEGGPRAVVEVRSLDEAEAALVWLDDYHCAAASCVGLLAKGAESGGAIGETGSFVLLQSVLDAVARRGLDVPVWLQGGVGLHTAAGVIVGGAAGVIVDTQLALTREADLPSDLAKAIAAMDGSETVTLGGYRVYTRPDLPAAALAEQAASGSIEPARVRDQLGVSLREGLVPLGQDAAFAAPLARRFPTAGTLLQAIARSIDEQPAVAAALQPLAADSSLASRHGLRYPIAQGPMTRVSDRAAFAKAVADGGGLPFLALALLRGPEVRDLLTETKALLGDQTWGVGILGFVPPELREEQLEVIHDIAPPVALIAGGRPSQSAPLDEAGIATFLHVPSPGLLDRFLKDGARRFVLEGRECGGHVGPRPSFALWEIQVQRFLAFAQEEGTDGKGSLEGVEVFFGGGIHDARSAAMVAGLAAPIVARGAAIGVLMGTAYLFTAEAVDGGAILPTFQQEAIDCERTVLLETSPGHATRCVDSAYVQSFLAEKARLQADGATSQEMWAELEQLNLGRLRIASKGLTRADDEIIEVDESTQRAEGMFMIGDVATLRSERTTVAELHDAVSSGGADHLAGFAGTSRATGEVEEAAPVDIAIVGMECFFPGAENAGQFWTNIVSGRDAVTEVPAERWNVDQYYDEHAFTEGAGVKTPSKWGGFLPDIPFDALAYGIPPRSLAAIEPVQLLALEVAQRALADAGYAEREFDRARVSVIFGAEAGTDLSSSYGFRSLLPTFTGTDVTGALDDFLPRLTEDSFPGLLTNVIAGRIANRLDLGGVNYTVDAACAASLAAVDLACKELVGGTSDMVLCGGADLHNGINDFLLFASVHALSPTGRCQTFDASADGIALGEGVACVVLKRLADAERDGDRIYAVIKGIAGSSDGRHLGLTAPRKEGQQRALERAYARAGIDPASVGLVEAHGTGTVVGDRTELATLTEVFSEAGAPVGGATVGSVKSNIGHTKCAAGLAGLIKAANAVYRGVRPPTLHVREPNPGYDAEASPFRIDTTVSPWIDHERVAGVSAFGFGGTNFHAVIARYDGDDGPEHGLDEWPAELVVFRAADRAAAKLRIDELRAWLEQAVADDSSVRLRDVAATVSLAGSGSVQVAVVAESIADLVTRLASASTFTAEKGAVFVADPPDAADGEEGAAPGRVAFLFPGQGSQRPGMLADLFVAFPWLHHHLEAGREWLPVLFPPAAFTRDEVAAQKDAITDTRVAQPTLGIAGSAMAEVLARLGITPDVAAGHSYGELVALSVAGALDERDLLHLSKARGEAILEAAGDDPGTMAAVSASAEEVDGVLAALDGGGTEGVVVANRNAPTQSVISGPSRAVDAAVEALGLAGYAAKPIAVACAFHSSVVAGASDELRAHLDAIEVREPSIEVWSNTFAAPYDSTPEGVRATLARQVAEPVRWAEQIEAMYAAGIRTFVECGPGRVLTQLVGKILGSRPHVVVATDASGEPGLRRLLLAVAELATHDVEFDPSVLYRGRCGEVDLRSPLPAGAQWTINGHLVRTRDGEVVPGGLRPFDEVPVGGLGGPAGVRSPEKDAAVVDYLRGMREVVATQREVMLRYLGGPVPEGSVVPTILDAASVERSAGAPAGALAEPAAASGGADRAPLTPDELRRAVLDIVSERTGYPLDMLDPDLDLEADLSIDSIKRIEILGELADRVGLPGADGDTIDESVVEELAQIKSINGMVSWIIERNEADALLTGDTAVLDEQHADAPSTEADPLAPDGVPVPDRTLRFVVRPIDAPVAERDPVDVLAGRAFIVVDDERGVALRLAALLEEHRATVRVVPADAELTGADMWCDGLIDLSSLAPGSRATAREVFDRVQAVALDGGEWIVVATGAGGTFGLGSDQPRTSADVTDTAGFPSGAGVPGLLRTASREFPAIRVRSVDVDPKRDPGVIAETVLDELLVAGPVVVGHSEHGRYTLDVVEEVAGGDDSSPSRLPGADGVALITGGARGITAKVAVGLARATGCRVVLLGRSPMPTATEDPRFADATDAPAVRKALIDQGVRSPAEIEAATSRVLAEREMRATLAVLTDLGVDATYIEADVRDAVALTAIIGSVRERFGRLDLVVHGAGVLEDKFMRDKTADSFARVFDTKVCGAGSLVAGVDASTTIVLFGSIAGVFGNRGQVDYAAANDALDALARSAVGREGARVLAVDWGPWEGGGMVSPELQREYERRGIGLVGSEEGVTALLDELEAGAPEPQVVFMRAQPDAMAPSGEP